VIAAVEELMKFCDNRPAFATTGLAESVSGRAPFRLRVRHPAQNINGNSHGSIHFKKGLKKP